MGKSRYCASTTAGQAAVRRFLAGILRSELSLLRVGRSAVVGIGLALATGLAASQCTPTVSGQPVKPVITSNVIDGTKEVSGTAGQPTSSVGGQTCSARVDLWLQLITGDIDMARQTDGRGHQTRALLGTAAVTGGKFDMKLSDPLLAGQSIFASEVSTGSTGGDEPPGSSDFVRVASFGNWGLVKAYFTSGFLLSEDQGSFSQSSLFLAFTLDKTWRLPGYYFPRITKGKSGKDVQEQGLRWPPGINSFFETRLTSIPVTSCAQTSTTGSPSSASSECATSSSSSSGTTPLDTFLANRKTARLDVGVYLPLTMTEWKYRGAPNTLFLAPIAKLGFDTPAGALSQAVPSNIRNGTATGTSTVTALNPTNFYTFYDFGGRFGHYAMTSSPDEAPEVLSYLDFMIGRFSNLESFVQKGTETDFRQRLWRVSVEGILKVPSTPLIIGFNANVGMSNPGAHVVRRAGDDLRFLFGARFDVAKLLAKIGQVSP